MQTAETSAPGATTEETDVVRHRELEKQLVLAQQSPNLRCRSNPADRQGIGDLRRQCVEQLARRAFFAAGKRGYAGAPWNGTAPGNRANDAAGVPR